MFKTKLGFVVTGLALGALAAGCGGSSEDPGTPVKESALTGTVASQTFSAKVALASSGSGGTSVTIYDTDVTCMGRFSAKGNQILLSVEKWMDGYSYQLGGTVDTPFGIPLPKYSVTFVTQESGGSPKNTIVSKGRVEVVKASAKGTDGVLRLRADGGEDGSVEGQVPVKHCEF
jgi:hypothetical protein